MWSVPVRIGYAQDSTCTKMSSSSSYLRVGVLATGLATHPDVTVVCGPSERDPQSHSHVTNPTMLVEVLSNATQV